MENKFEVLVFIIKKINVNRSRSNEECTLSDPNSDLKIHMNYLSSLKKSPMSFRKLIFVTLRRYLRHCA